MADLFYPEHIEQLRTLKHLRARIAELRTFPIEDCLEDENAVVLPVAFLWELTNDALDRAERGAIG